MNNSNLNRIFHALKRHHGRAMTRKQLKALAVKTAKQYPWFHRFGPNGDTAPWLGSKGQPTGRQNTQARR